VTYSTVSFTFTLTSLISVIGGIDLMSMKNPNDPMGIELATFQLLAQCLTQLRHRRISEQFAAL
jgi:hypothetical protein